MTPLLLSAGAPVLLLPAVAGQSEDQREREPKDPDLEDEGDDEEDSGDDEGDDEGGDVDADLDDDDDEDEDEPAKAKGAEKAKAEASWTLLPAPPITRTLGEDGTLRVHAESLLDVTSLPPPKVRHLNADTVQRLWHGGALVRKKTSKGKYKIPEDWAGPAPSLDKYRRLVEKGDPEAAEVVRELMQDLEGDAPPAIEIRRRSTWRNDGDEIDMDRVRAGQHESAWWGAHRSNHSASPIVRLYVSLAVGWQIKPEMLFWAGAATAAIAELGERAGWRVEIIACGTSHGLQKYGAPEVKRVSATWTVKRSDEPLDLEGVAASICNASANRTAAFAMWIDALDRLKVPCTPHTGFAWPGRPSFLEEDDIWISGCYSESDAREAVRKTLDALRARAGG